MSFYSTKTCKARKARRCSGCDHPGKIQPGDYYLVHTEFPGGDAGYADAAGHPVRMAECADCATRYGRAALLPAAPAGTNQHASLVLSASLGQATGQATTVPTGATP